MTLVLLEALAQRVPQEVLVRLEALGLLEAQVQLVTPEPQGPLDSLDTPVRQERRDEVTLDPLEEQVSP